MILIADYCFDHNGWDIFLLGINVMAELDVPGHAESW